MNFVNRLRKYTFLGSANVLPVRGFQSRSLAKAEGKHPFGIVFDIDGVLIRGYNPLPHSKKILELLDSKRIPYVFLTNGGGQPEFVKAASLQKIIGHPVDGEKVILSHSPMRSLVPQYKDKFVLLVGSGPIESVAKHYGFNKFMTLEQYAKCNPDLFPFRSYEKKEITPTPPVDCVLVINDSVEWGENLQILVDVLMSNGTPGKLSDKQVVPIHFSNPDFVWSAAFPFPRFAQGAFKECLQHLYKRVSGRTLEYVQYGKPTDTTYLYAENVINNIYGKGIQRFYGIGDNPTSDIRGARNARLRHSQSQSSNITWTSFLVRTGCFQEGENDAQDPADYVCDDVSKAVETIFKLEGLSSEGN